MPSSLSLEKRNEICDFFKKEFHIDISRYSDQELSNLLETTNDLLEKRIKIEEQELEDLKKKLENEKMLLESSITDTN